MSGYSELRDLGVTFRPYDGPLPPAGGTRSPFQAGWSDTVDTLARELWRARRTRVVFRGH